MGIDSEPGDIPLIGAPDDTDAEETENNIHLQETSIDLPEPPVMRADTPPPKKAVKVEKKPQTRRAKKKKQAAAPAAGGSETNPLLQNLKSQWDEIEKMAAVHEQVTAELAQAHARADELERDLSVAQVEAQRFRKTAEDAGELKPKLDAAILSNKMLEEELGKVKEKAKKSAAEAEAAKSELQSLQKQLTTAEAEVKKRTEDRKESEAKIAAAKAALEGKLQLLKPKD